ncbi:hypothetical protein GCM10023162_01440 [Klenkia terrae]
MGLLLLAHLVAAVLAPLLVRWWGRSAYYALALVPAAGFAWLAAQLSTVLDGGTVDERTTWIPALDLDVTLRLDSLALAVAALVTGVGALVFVYCARYFEPGDEGLGRFAGVLMAFAGSMLGLVVADDMLLLYVFWELTTVFSFLLIGGSGAKVAGRRAAQQALIVTTAGGLAMLVGLIMIGQASGSYLLSEVVANPGTGPVVTVGVLLVLAGAVTKSAMVPFHFWLPAAMEAPTPTSAYLHAAAMVKAGIYLVARLAPGFADTPGWKPVVIGLGLATMLLGGYRALRQYDLKLLLAFGTVSQLGFLMVLVGTGSREAAAAGIAMLLAHGLFKSTLFLVVGVVDHTCGTRDLREINGLGKRLPVLAVIASLAGASMAGLPPLLGFVGKEAAFTAFLDGGLESRVWASLTLLGLLLGSVLTVAYTARFLWGAFGTGGSLRRCAADRPSPEHLHRPGPAFLAAPAVLAVLGLLAGPFSGLLEPLVAPYADTLPLVAEEAEELALWHGWQPALLLSLVTLGGGLAPFAAGKLVARLQRRVAVDASADEGYWHTMRGLDVLAQNTTRTTQRGSLPTYLGVILVVLVALPGSMLVFRAPWPDDLRAWDTPAQALIGLVVLGAAALAVRIRQRLSAVLVVGVTGYGVGLLFALQGAPDLALTQFLVETLTLVTFVLVLRKLPKDISDRHRAKERRGGHRGARRPDGDPGVGGLPAAGLRLRRRREHRQRDPGRHPGLGHDARGVAARRGGHRRGQPGLPPGAHRLGRPGHRRGQHLRGRPPRTARPLAGRQRDPGPAAPVGHPRGGHPRAVPHDRRPQRLPAVQRAQRARRRVRRRPGRRPRAGAALPRRRPVRARRGRAGRPGQAAGRRSAAGRRHRDRRAGAGRRRTADHDPAGHLPGARRRQARHRAVLRHRGLPDRHRPGARRPPQPRRADRRRRRGRRRRGRPALRGRRRQRHRCGRRRGGRVPTW